jgi:hypothetical protein
VGTFLSNLRQITHTKRLEIFGVVVFIAQYETCLLGQLLDQQRGDTAVVDVGRNRATLTRYILPANP